MIQRLLEARARPTNVTDGGTTTTLDVMLRLLPPPRALVVIHEPHLRAEVERTVTACLLEAESLSEDGEGLRRLAENHRPMVITDSLELIRRIRHQRAARTPFIRS